MAESFIDASKSVLMNCQGLVGGTLIGLSAAILLLFSGEIMGSSGIVNSLLLNHPLSKNVNNPAQHWKMVFVLTFLVVSQLIQYFYAPGEGQPTSIASVIQTAANSRPALAYIIGGLWVGFGTKLGNGCTSGHGICGLGRMSPRSFTAVMTFMVTAIVGTVLDLGNQDFLRPSFFERLSLSNKTEMAIENDPEPQFWSTELFPCTSQFVRFSTALLTMFVLYATTIATKGQQQVGEGWSKILPGMVAGSLFALCLFWSGMNNPATVMAF